MTPAPMMLSTKPSLAFSSTVNTPEPKTTAFGPVATGSMKAKLALIVAGIISSFGSIPAAIEPAARIGISSAVVAVLLVISVRKLTLRQSRMMTKTIELVIGQGRARRPAAPRVRNAHA